MKHSGWGLQGGSQPPQAGSSRPAGSATCYPVAGGRCAAAVQRQPERDHHITCKHKLGHSQLTEGGLCNQAGFSAVQAAHARLAWAAASRAGPCSARLASFSQLQPLQA